jgi:predicted membrane-bound mannosyltransferase
VPYRDFFTFYTPGSFYFLALWLRIFGDSFAVARASIAIVGAICSVLTYLLARRVCTVGMAVFVAVLATTAGAGFRFLVLHNWYSTLLSCLTHTAHVSWKIAKQSGPSYVHAALL